jgi:hypothetical protein
LASLCTSFVISLEDLSIVPLLFCIFFILEYIWFVAGTASVNPLCLKLLLKKKIGAKIFLLLDFLI